MNLNEMLEMLEHDVLSGMEKKAGEVKDESKETPAIAEEFTKSAAARKEAEDLGAQVARTLLKQAEDEKSKEEKKDEEKKEEKDEEKSESKEDKDEKSESKEDEKSNPFMKEENMDKKASLVDIITNMLEKSALNEGSDNVAAPGPNLIQADTAALVADQDAIIAPTPGTDGATQGGTVNQILDAIVAKAQAQGAVNPDQAAAAPSAPAERQDDDVEKTAAVVALVEAGVDFDQAVDLVKQAEYEIQEEAFEVEKQAAFSALIEAGIDFDQATDLVKEACEDLEKQAASMHQAVAGQSMLQSAVGRLKGIGSAAKGGYVNAATKANKYIQDQTGATSWGELGGKVKDKAARGAKLVGNQYKGSIDSAAYHGKRVITGSNAGRLAHAGELAKNRAVQTAAGITAAAGGAAAYNHQKKAAFDGLIAEGFDFETAVEIVKQASAEVGM